MIHSSIENVQPEQVMNNEPEAQDISVSPSIANALVGGSCYRCVHCGKIVNRDSVKEWIKSWCEQSQKYVRLQKI
jgi:hypothetical protein